jgi:hypothetical protein
LSLLLAACSEEHHVPLGKIDAGTDAGATEEIDASVEFAECDDDDSDIPASLVCSGLYASLIDKRIAKSVVEFKPAFPLWSDGADKRRWIQLPEGKKIDNSQPNGWVFPVGTKLWKEFAVNKKRVETRLFWKIDDLTWRKGTYEWNADESEATVHLGGDIQVKGETYHLPTKTECDDCHGGQPDRVLGFSAVNLGLDGADGVTLKQLWEQGLLTTKPPILELSIGADETGMDDDGLPLAAKVLGVLHTNCGQTCHNPTPRAKAGLSKQNLRLDSTLLDGRAPDQAFGTIGTAIGQRAEGVQWNNHPFRILPGDPENSLIHQLMSYRDPTGMGRGQMPPIATRKVDDASVKLIEKWIRLLGDGTSPADAGTSSDAGETSVAMDASANDQDAGMDAGAPDTGSSQLDGGVDAGDDAGMDAGVDAGEDAGAADADLDADSALEPDAGEPDAGEPDAGEPDAGEPDTGM